MDNETTTLMQEITAFEKQLEGAGSHRSAEESVPSEDAKLATDIAEVEQILAGLNGYMDENGDVGMVEEQGTAYMDLDLTSDDLLDDDYDEPAMIAAPVASEANPSGIEEEITDDRFSEVERLLGDTGIVDAEHTFDVAPTDLNHTAGMKEASTRLDNLASYIEDQVVNHGENKEWMKVAYRIDKMADGIDARINAEQEAG